MTRKDWMNPLNLADAYKFGHYGMYPDGMERLQSNWTPRGSRIEGVDHAIFFGLQGFIENVLLGKFCDPFFGPDGDMWIDKHKARVEGMIGHDFDVSHWRELRKLGHLPLRFSALPEGTRVPLRVPMFKIENTVDGYGWLVNYFETLMSCAIWQEMVSATTAFKYRNMLDKWAAKTSDTPEFVDWQGHDFSFRGMSGPEAAAVSGAGHLLSFAGTDTTPAIDYAEAFYNASGPVGGSVYATEHSVMCAGGKEDELLTFIRLLDRFTGILSVVSDTWSLWDVITKILPQPEVYNRVMGRDGKLVIRPDSGDPVDILCGNPEGRTEAEEKGVIQLLYELFGGSVNSKGYKVLDPHIGAIYGDAITYPRADAICRRLAYKGFASTNVVLGIGSYTYQYVTRDTLGFAMKATWCQTNGEPYDLFKDPVTDSGTKRSARGRVAVGRDERGNLVLINGADLDADKDSLLKPVWENGEFVRRTTFKEIIERLGVRTLVPDASV